MKNDLKTNKNDTILSELWTTKQAAAYLNTTPKSLTSQRYLGYIKDLKCYRIGRKVMYKKCDLDAWIEKHAENIQEANHAK